MINHNISKVYKIIDRIDNKFVDNATITIEELKVSALNKKDGFYIFTNIKKGLYTIKITCEHYKTLKFKTAFNYYNDTIEAILLEIDNNDNLLNKIVVKDILYINNKIQINKEYYYAVLNNVYRQRILFDIKKGDNKIKFNFVQEMLLYNRNIAIEGVNDIYTIESYDYNDNNYILNNCLKEDIKSGKYIYILNKSITDSYGKYDIMLSKDDIEEQKHINILFIVENKKENILVNL